MYPGFTVTIKSNFIVRIYIQILLLSIETEKNFKGILKKPAGHKKNRDLTITVCKAGGFDKLNHQN